MARDAASRGGYALMWSGGKDSALALQRATAAGIQVTRLINFYDRATRRVRFHATRVSMIQAQADAAGIELRAIGTTWPEMESRLNAELAALRSEGFAGVVFGDIHLTDVRSWYEDRVKAAGLEHIEPIWGEEPARLIREFVEAGGRAVITCVDLSRLDSAWLGRIIDERFLEEIATTEADPCGENGEYHSFAFQGPAFSNPIQWSPGERRSEPGFIQLDIFIDVLPG
jgi:diphthine-ammonia ligase